ncbi:DUF3017 domain-containing protein [Streptomyces sp. NPDC055085]
MRAGARTDARAEAAPAAENGTRAERAADAEAHAGAPAPAETEVSDPVGTKGVTVDESAAEPEPRPDAAADADADAGMTVRDAVSAPDADGRPRRTTRRFPLFTRDTARPEGGGRAAPGDAPAPARQWPILTVLAAVGLGLLLTALDVFRAGTILIGAALIAGAVMRWVLPSVGMLAVRSRFTDMVTYGVLGVVIVLLALMAQPHPVLVIPFLDDTLHFTVR